MYSCMAAAGPVYRQAGWSGNPFLLPLHLPAGMFEQKRPARRQAGCNGKPGQKLKHVLRLKAPNKNGNEKFIAVQYYFKNYLAMFTALFSLITVTFICPGKVISVCIF